MEKEQAEKSVSEDTKEGSLTLKELTLENHRKAERRAFAKKLLSGKIDPKEYYKYLTNQYYNYVILEVTLIAKGFPHRLWNVFRRQAIKEDLQELEETYGFTFAHDILTRSTTEYPSHVESLDYEGLLAHMYVRHFGDMYGGSIIKGRIPGSGRMYDFEDKENLKTSLRSILNNDMADEANKCFEFATRLFEELEDAE